MYRHSKGQKFLLLPQSVTHSLTCTHLATTWYICHPDHRPQLGFTDFPVVYPSPIITLRSQASVAWHPVKHIGPTHSIPCMLFTLMDAYPLYSSTSLTPSLQPFWGFHFMLSPALYTYIFLAIQSSPIFST